jgi:hypothetical protein
MKFDALLAYHLRGTALEPGLVKEYLKTPPHYYQWGLVHRVDQRSLDQLMATDLFEFYLRQYLTGRHRTLRALLRAVRVFARQDARGAPYLIGYSLASTRQHLLKLEWYELLERLETARLRILSLAPTPRDATRPSLIDSLETSYEPMIVDG